MIVNVPKNVSYVPSSGGVNGQLPAAKIAANGGKGAVADPENDALDRAVVGAAVISVAAGTVSVAMGKIPSSLSKAVPHAIATTKELEVVVGVVPNMISAFVGYKRGDRTQLALGTAGAILASGGFRVFTDRAAASSRAAISALPGRLKLWVGIAQVVHGFSKVLAASHESPTVK